MEYLKVKCHRCGNSFHLCNRDMSHEEKPHMCPHCLVRMDKTQWERLVEAYFVLAEVNKDFRRYHTDKGEPLFQAEILTEEKYVAPEDIVLTDDFIQGTGTGKSKGEIEKDMKTLAQIIGHPVPNRNIADYEEDPAHVRPYPGAGGSRRQRTFTTIWHRHPLRTCSRQGKNPLTTWMRISR